MFGEIGVGSSDVPSAVPCDDRAKLRTMLPQTTSVHFQLVGASLYGMDRRQLERTHAFDLNHLNEIFIQRLNGWVPDESKLGSHEQPKPFMSAGYVSAVAVPGEQPERLFTVRFVVGGSCTLAHVWSVLSEVADEVMARAFARLQLCRCDL